MPENIAEPITPAIPGCFEIGFLIIANIYIKCIFSILKIANQTKYFTFTALPIHFTIVLLRNLKKWRGKNHV